MNTFSPNSPQLENKQYEFYTIVGQHDFLDKEENPRVNNDGNNVYAKKSMSSSKTRYWIKVGTYGKIFNPIGLYSEGTANKFVAKIGKKIWEFKEVNQKVFDMYVNFLRTKNIAWINNAEREMA
jgi:hypothetical protein